MATKRPTDAEIVAEFWKLDALAGDPLSGDAEAGAARDALGWVLGDNTAVSEGYE